MIDKMCVHLYKKLGHYSQPQHYGHLGPDSLLRRVLIMFAISPGLYPLVANNDTPSHDKLTRLQTLPKAPWGASLPPVENH